MNSTATSAKQQRPLQPPSRGLQDRLLLIWDVVIVALVSLNLALILFDSLFAVAPINAFLESTLPALHRGYGGAIHQHFQQIDLYFVALFVADVIAGWTYAVVQKRYQRWWFYPFARWYDVLGCIPLSGFRLLRVLRIISLLFRLQKLGFIDIRRWPVYAVFMRYYGIVMEELSDRVVENVLTSVQDEVNSGASQLPGKIIRDVVLPRQDKLARGISVRVAETMTTLHRENRDELRRYIARLVANTVEHHPAARQLDRIPGVGDSLVDALQRNIADTCCDVIDEVITSLSTPEFERTLRDILNSFLNDLLRQHSQTGSESGAIMIEVLELLKQQVRKKRWLEDF